MFIKSIKTIIFFLILVCFQLEVLAQVTLDVTINSGSSTTTCNDGSVFGVPLPIEPGWGVNIAGEGWTYYDPTAPCYNSTPNTQYSESYNCFSTYPSAIQVCINAFEDDGVACSVVTTSCLEQNCQNFSLPALGTSFYDSMSITGTSGATVYFTITTSGSFPATGNDFICDAIDLGTLNSGGTLGDNTLSNYNNYCATNTGDPNPWGGNNDQAVWFQFTTGPSPAATIEFDANSDPANIGDNIDLQLALYESSNDSCSGTLSLIQDEYDGLGLFDDEEMTVSCLEPNTTYFLLVDGESTFLINTFGQEGYFGLAITDNGIAQAADFICDAQDLGVVPLGASVTSGTLNQSNICATNIGDPTPAFWASNNTVWYSFTAPASGSVQIDANSDLPFPLGTDAIDLQLAIYSSSNGTCTGTLSELASNYTPGFLDEELNIRCLTPGESYFVMVDGSAINIDGIFDLTITDILVPPASNDLICNAITLGAPTVGSPVSALNQNNYCADNLFEPIPTNWGNNQGVWYTFIAPPSGKVEIRLDDYGLLSPDRIDLQVACYDLNGAICSGTPTELKSEHDGIGIIWDEEMEVECLVPGREYWILVDGEGSLIDPDLREGVFDIEVVADPRDPAAINNTPCNAIALGDPTGTPIGTTPGLLHGSQNNYCADAIGEPQPSNFTADQTVWYTFVAPLNGSVNIDVISDLTITGIDPINLEIAVWSSPTCSGPWQEVVSGSDLLYDIDIDVYCLDIGQTYYIQIDGAPPTLLGGHEGYFDLTITEIPPIPVSPNDLICNATNLGNPWNGTINITNQHNLCAGNIGDSIPSAFVPDQTVWYTFTTPLSGGPFAIDIQATSDLPWPFGVDAVDLQLAVFESSDNTCTGSLSEVASEYSLLDLFNEFMNVPCLEAGNTYYLMVDGSGLNVQGYFDINLSAATAIPIPINDDICNNISLGAVPIGGSINDGVDYSNFCASTEPGEPNPFSIEQTVWFSFIAPAHAGLNATSNVTVSVTSDPGGLGNTIDLQLAIYESNNALCTGSLSLIEGGSTDPAISLDASLSVSCLEPGQEYWVQIDGSSLNQEGYFRIEIQDDGAGVRPVNNLICNATSLGVVPDGGSINNGVNYSNLCSDTEVGEPNPAAFNIDRTVWFTFEAPTSGNITINALSDPNLIGDSVDLQLALWYFDNDTCSGNFLEVESNYDPLNFNESIGITCLEAGRSYFLQVDGSSNITNGIDGWFTLEIVDEGGSTNAPYNNNICNAYDFGTPSAIQTLLAESNECANVEVDEPGVAGYATHTVWYEFIAPLSGSIEIEVVSTNTIIGMDPEVYLYSSSNDTCTGTLQLIEQSNSPTALITENISSNCLIPGNTYYIQVDGQLLELNGTFNISIEDPNPLYGSGLPGDTEPINNDCSNATVLSVQSESCFSGTGIFDQFNYGNPTISNDGSFIMGCGTNCGETWYQFTMPASENILIEGNDDNIGGDFSNLNITAYSGTCGALSSIDCDTGGLNSNPILSFGAPAGTTIWLQVSNNEGDDNNELFELCVSEGCGFDDCLDAVASPIIFGTSYCFNTTTATGETIPAENGYFECSENDSPENSVYFYFETPCNNEVTISLINVQIAGSCILGITPTDGMNLTLMEDTSPCDNLPNTLVDCQSFTSCDILPLNWSQTYTGLTPNSSYVILIDGGFGALGGDVNGEILITGLSPDSTFANATTCNSADTGVAVQNLMNANLCDSVHTITTTLLASDSTFASATSCLPADTGVAVQNLMNANLCDSVHTITTTLLQSDSTFATATSSLPADTGIAVQNLLNINGCDSIHTITTTLLVQACPQITASSFLVNGNGCGGSETEVYLEDFEGPANIGYTTSGVFSDGSNDYFDLIGELTDPTGLPAYTGANGTQFWACEDTEDVNNPNLSGVSTISITGISIIGISNLQLSGLFAAGSTSHFDDPDYLNVSVQIDGGGYNLLGAFEGAGGFNTSLLQDTDLDGIGDGSALGLAFQNINFPISGTGALLDIQIEIFMSAGNEAVALDSISISGNTAGNCFACPEDTLTLSVNGTDLPEGGTIDWYYDTIPSYNPFSSEGTYIGSSLIPVNVTCSSPTVIINELEYRPSINNGTDPNSGDRIELLGPPGADLSCYVLTDGDWTITFPAGSIIPADGLFTIGNDNVYGAGYFNLDAENCGCFTDGAGGSSLLVLTDGGEYIALFDQIGTFVQGIVYGTPSAGNTPPNGALTTAGVINTIGSAGCPASVTIPSAASFETAPGGLATGTSLIRNPDGIGTWSTQVGGSINDCNVASIISPILDFEYIIPQNACNETRIYKGIINPHPNSTTCLNSDSSALTEEFTIELICPNGTLDTSICNGDSFIFNGTIYNGGNLSGIETLTSVFGCDSIVTVNVSERLIDSTFANAATCNPVDTGIASVTNANQFGCDSVHTITTTLLLSDSTFASATSCLPADTGVAVQNLMNVNLCDSVHTITTTLLLSDSTFASATSCLPADTGVAVQNLMNVNLCDSVHTITTTLLLSDSTFASATSCLPADTGVAVQNLMNVNLCDSVHTITTTLLLSDSTFASATSCLPADTGVAVQNLMNANLCDSVHTITTTLLLSDSTFANATSCLPADTGVAVQNLMNANLCDSVHTITTILLLSDSTFASATSCLPADTGVAVQNLMNANLCDSVHTITTTLLLSDSTFASATSCLPADTGVAVQNLMNVNLCDSVHTITTTLLLSDSTFANATSCLPADTGVAVQNLMNVNLCDSVHTITTTLLLSDSTFASATSCLPADTGVAVQNLMNVNLCDSVHTITTTLLLSDSTFASATSCLPADTGVAVQNLMNANLCDSVHTITTTLLLSDSTFASATSCLPADTGVAVQNLMNANLCDSVHTITTTLLLSDSTFANATSCLPADTGVTVQNLMNANLCDSVHTITTTLLLSDSTFASATSCLPADTGVAVQNLMNANLCDSVHTITTTLLLSDSTFASATSCLPADTGVAVQNLMNVNLCDSVHTITTTLLLSDSTFASATSCLPADTGVAVQNLMNANLCDSVHTITTTLLLSDSTFANATSCLPADTGVAVQNLMNANLCDSVHTITTILLLSDSTFASATSCLPADTGVAVQNLMNANLCDSVHTITTTLLLSDSTFASATSCLPADTGVAVQNLMNVNLCDSVHTITTTLLLSDSTFANATSCLPADTGVAVQNLMNVNLCDSVHTITTTLLLSDSTFASATSCLPADTGVAVQNLMNVNLCDSVHTITTTLLLSDSTFASATSCLPADTGVAVQNLMNANLCDSVHTITTTLLLSDSTFASATSCLPADTGVAVQNLMNANLCDSVHTITTTLLLSDSTFANATSCLPADTGVTVQNLMNANLCDSVHTITTTLLLSDSTFASATSCLPADTGVAVQNLMNANLCDSVHTITTTLLLSDSTFASATSCLPADTGVAVQNLMNVNLCDSVHTITTTLLLSDSTFASATSCLPADTGVAVQNLMNANLCDSVHTITTTLLLSDSTFASATSCLPADTGVAVQNLMNANLCDSVHTITTTLLLSDSTFANATSCLPADTGVTVQNLMNANLCDSVHTITTTLLLSDSTFASATSCLPADTGVAVQNLMNANLCDSVHTITTTLLLSDSTFASATSCLPADTGVAVQNLMNANLCDSVHTITTTLLLSDSTFASATSCLPADTGVAVQNLMNANLCDSVHTITTTLLLSDSTFANATSCLPADTGVAVQNLMNVNLCDSVHTITTTLLLSDSTFANATSCLPADTGVAVQNLMNVNLCDSVHTITTTLLLSDSTFASATSCLPADTGVAVQNLMNVNLCDSVHTITTTLLLSDSTFASATSCLPADTGVAVQNLMNVNLCDSVHTITTTLLLSDSTFASATSCLPADTGVAVQNLMNANLCDSVHTITTTLLLSDSTFANATSCLPADTGVAVQNLMNANLCDSVHTITTILLLSDSTFASATSCLPADTGVAVQNLMNANLCDSVHTITTTLLLSDSTFANATSCLPADTGVAVQNLMNANLCDSVHTITTILLLSDSTFASATSCLPADTGVAVQNLMNANLCDSVHTITTTLLLSDSTFASATSCLPADTGVAVQNLMNANLCDSVHTITTTLLLSDSTFASATSCLPADTGVAVQNLMNVNLCDSVHTITTTLLLSDSTFASATSCLPADTGVAVQNLMNVNLCDSVHTITTTLLLSDSTFASATSCLPADTGVAVQNLMNANLCDSVHTITTTLLLSDSTFASATSCLPADTGVAVQNLMNANLCDSVHTITTTLLLSDSTFANATSCLPADTGVAVQNLMNANLCDSVHTITTTLLLSDSTFANATSCLPADTGVTVQNLMNANLCDSVHTITTTLLPSHNIINNVSICEDALPFVFPNGSIYNINSNITQVSNFISSLGCDSNITTNLSVNNIGIPGITPDTIAVCESFNIQIEMNAMNMQTFQWQLNDGSGFVNINDAGIYTGTNTGTLTISPLDVSLTGNIYRIVMTDECGNGGYQDETYVRVSEPQEVANPIEDVVRCLRDSTLIYVDYNGYNYVWSNGQTGQFLMVEEAGNYEVSFIENGTNCAMMDDFDVVIEDCVENCVVLAPTGFTPQGSNGVNDIFRVMTSCEEGFSFFEFRVYNRWGELVYITNNSSDGWDGTYKNINAMIGVYIYYVEYTKNGQNKKELIKGQVTLVR